MQPTATTNMITAEMIVKGFMGSDSGHQSSILPPVRRTQQSTFNPDNNKRDFFGNPLMQFTWTNSRHAGWDMAPNTLARKAPCQEAVNISSYAYDPDVLRPTLDSSQQFHFAGFNTSSQPLLSCRVPPQQRLNPAMRAAMSTQRHYTAELVSDDDEVLGADWKSEEEKKQSQRDILLGILLGTHQRNAEKKLPILAPKPRKPIHINLLEADIGAWTNRKCRPLRERVTPPRPLDIGLCEEYAEEERAYLGEQVKIVIGSDDESDEKEVSGVCDIGERDFTECLDESTGSESGDPATPPIDSPEPTYATASECGAPSPYHPTRPALSDNDEDSTYDEGYVDVFFRGRDIEHGGWEPIAEHEEGREDIWQRGEISPLFSRLGRRIVKSVLERAKLLL